MGWLSRREKDVEKPEGVGEETGTGRACCPHVEYILSLQPREAWQVGRSSSQGVWRGATKSPPCRRAALLSGDVLGDIAEAELGQEAGRAYYDGSSSGFSILHRHSLRRTAIRHRVPDWRRALLVVSALTLPQFSDGIAPTDAAHPDFSHSLPRLVGIGRKPPPAKIPPSCTAILEHTGGADTPTDKLSSAANQRMIPNACKNGNGYTVRVVCAAWKHGPSYGSTVDSPPNKGAPPAGMLDDNLAGAAARVGSCGGRPYNRGRSRPLRARKTNQVPESSSHEGPHELHLRCFKRRLGCVFDISCNRGSLSSVVLVLPT
jgi:hypothetical protein